MIIKNGYVFEDDGRFVQRDIFCKDNRIVEHAEDTGEVVDASGLYVLPGFVDIHTHGGAGHDFCDADVSALCEIARYQKSRGVTSFCPTSMTFPEARLTKIFQTVKDIAYSDECARIAGINMEGPFICEEKRGAQNPAYIEALNVELFERLNHSCGNRIRLVTIAPELEGADEFIRRLSGDVCISIGHSNADYAAACRAIEQGVCHITHLFNAMPSFHHRDPGIVGAAADYEQVTVEVICDGIHIHPSMIRSIYRLFGDDRVILISDSMEAAGMPDGVYELGGQKVTKQGGRAVLEDGTIAGSATHLFDCFRNAVDFGIPLASAVKMASANPARRIGMEGRTGTLRPGAFADILLVDQGLRLVRVI